ncbi:hypothetical protein [Streptomyces griseoaurantiacus]|uniref:hypothetical protein n=1 Tax=Streptomyces griseoaurantiacus TaxID=68213 RepID=UPI003681E753
MDFTVPPEGLLVGEGVYVYGRAKNLPMSGPLLAHWDAFAARNPDLKVWTKTMEGLLRALLEEEHASVQAARAEYRRTGKPARPKPGPLLTKVREQVRQIRAESGKD